MIVSRRLRHNGDIVGTYRFNVIDERGTASFLGPRHGSKMVAAACGVRPRSMASMAFFSSGWSEPGP